MNDITASGHNHGTNDRKGAEGAVLFPIEAGSMADLHTRLATMAADHGLLDVAYRTIDTPVGPLLLATTETGLVRVAFEREDFERHLAQAREALGLTAAAEEAAGARFTLDEAFAYALGE